MSNIRDLLNIKIEGSYKPFSKKEIFEIRYLDEILSNIDLVLATPEWDTVSYTQLLPVEFLKELLVGKVAITTVNSKVSNYFTIEDCFRSNSKGKFNKKSLRSKVIKCQSLLNDKCWVMYLDNFFEFSTLRDREYFNRIKNKYYVKFNLPELLYLKQRLINLKKELQAKGDKINSKVDLDIYNTLADPSSKIDLPTEQLRNPILRSKPEKVESISTYKDIFKSILTDEEKQKLIKWVSENVYSMRLYLLKDGKYDKKLSALFPDDIYGKKRRTVPSCYSKDTLGGYISFTTLTDCPFEIIGKICGTQNLKATLSLFKFVSNNFRLNNYKLVLYLLANYNEFGFKTGIRNLYKKIQTLKVVYI